jgi:hypothetical protein
MRLAVLSIILDMGDSVCSYTYATLSTGAVSSALAAYVRSFVGLWVPSTSVDSTVFAGAARLRDGLTG